MITRADRTRVDVLAIGHLSRNRYWGESDHAPVRPACCTSTLVRAAGFTLVVDPGHPPEQMVQLLDRRAGLRPDDVDAVFVTHRHADHRVGIGAFAESDLWMAGDELTDWRQNAADGDRVITGRFGPAPEMMHASIWLLPTSGHTVGHTSVVVAADIGSVVIAGDAVMTRDFFRAEDVYLNTVDDREARAAIRRIAGTATFVVPGHDNVFPVHER